MVHEQNSKPQKYSWKFFFTDTSFFGGDSKDKKRERFRKEKSKTTEAPEQLFDKRPGKITLKEDTSPDSVQITDSVSPTGVVKPMLDVIYQIGSKDTSARLDKTNTVYHQQSERIIAMDTINMKKNDNSYDNEIAGIGQNSVLKLYVFINFTNSWYKMLKIKYQ